LASRLWICPLSVPADVLFDPQPVLRLAVESLDGCFQRFDASLKAVLFLLTHFQLELLQHTPAPYPAEKRKGHPVPVTIARTWNHDALVSHDTFDHPSDHRPDGKFTRPFAPNNVDVPLLNVVLHRLLQRLFLKAALRKVLFKGYPADRHGGPQQHRAESVLSDDDGRHAFRGHVQAFG
jgi:hypothetical protein